MNHLDEQLMEYDNPSDMLHTDNWRIEDLDTAAWASRKAADASANISSIDAWQAKQIRRVMEVANQERERYEKDLSFFTDHLGSYLSRLIHEGRKTKTLNLPGGDVSIRTKKGLVQVDSASAIEWAEENDIRSVLRVKTELDKRAFDALVTHDGGKIVATNTGEVLPFATWKEEEQTVAFHPVSQEENE